MDPIHVPACLGCRHYRPAAPLTCDAFPARIPDRIWLEGDPHTGPVAGDGGIRFEPIPGGRRPGPAIGAIR